MREAFLGGKISVFSHFYRLRKTNGRSDVCKNLSNWSSGVQIPWDICTRFGCYLYPADRSWIINLSFYEKYTNIQRSSWQTACRSFLEKQPCAMQGISCKCAERDSSPCGTLNQQVFVNITGAKNEQSSQWRCCYCAQNESYCCDMCSRGTGKWRSLWKQRKTLYFSIYGLWVESQSIDASGHTDQ